MRTVIIYSGGMDSFTLLHDAIQEAGASNVTALSFDYGQRHEKELRVASSVCHMLPVAHYIINLTSMCDLLPGSALTDLGIDVPEGHYEEESMKATVVPNRNMIMLSIATAHAIAIEADQVMFGAHAGDHAVYPDCRSEFIMGMNEVTRIGNYLAPVIRAPYIARTKGQILERGRILGLTAGDYANTWTCYKGDMRPCGKCGACRERLEAFESIGWGDPLTYAPHDPEEEE